MPKVDFLDHFWDTGPPRLDLFCILVVSVRYQKKHVVPIDQKWTKNPKNWPQGRHKAKPDAKDSPIFASWVPWPATRATELIDTRLVEEGKEAS